MSSFIEYCKKLIDEHGVPKAANYIINEHNAGNCDAIAGLLELENKDDDFWQLDQLASDVIKRVKKFDLRKAIELCVKMQEFEGNDLASGMLYNSLEQHLTKNPESARAAFDIVVTEELLFAALPCVSRVMSQHDSEYVRRRLSGNRAISHVFSLQFCATDKPDIRQEEELFLSSIAEDISADDILKRAVYITAQKWGFDAICCRLRKSGNPHVLLTLAFELSKADKITDEALEELLLCFDSLDPKYEFVWDRLDWALQCQFDAHPIVCKNFLRRQHAHKVLSGFIKKLADEQYYGQLLPQIANLLSSGDQSDELLAYKLASKVKIGASFNIPELEVDANDLPYTVRKSLGWLYARECVCIPIILGLISQMDTKAWREVSDDFYDPICLHFIDSVERYLAGLKFADISVGQEARAVISRARNMFDSLDKYGPCNELLPSAEMLATANKRESAKMAEAFKMSNEMSLLNQICGHSIALLHGGKMVSYVASESDHFRRAEVPMRHHSMSFKVPRLMALSESHLEDRLAVFRMERKS